MTCVRRLRGQTPPRSGGCRMDLHRLDCAGCIPRQSGIHMPFEAFAVWRSHRVAAIAAITVASSLASVQAATITVDNTQDSNSPFVTACTSSPNDCSFWGALLAANVNADADTIVFDIPVADDPGCVPATGVCRVTTPSSNVSVNYPVVIDGTTQPGASVNTLSGDGNGVNMVAKIELARSAAFAQNSIIFRRSTTIRGLSIFRNSGQQNAQGPMFRFLAADGDHSFKIEGNMLGVFADGTLPQNAAFINFFQFGECGEPNMTPTQAHFSVGGLLPAERNWIVAGDPAIKVNACEFGASNMQTDTKIQGNLFGTSQDGLSSRINDVSAYRWIDLQLSGDPPVLIGGALPAARNVFVRAYLESVRSNDMYAGPTLIRVLGNYFGLGVDGETPLVLPIYPQNPGAALIDINRGQIGGIAPGERNFFVANQVTSIVMGGMPINLLSNVYIGNEMFSVVNLNRSSTVPGLVERPEFSAFGVAAGNATFTYRVPSTTAQSTYPLTVEFYKAGSTNNPSILLGRDTYTAGEATTNKTISLPLPPGVTLSTEDLVLASANAANEKGTSDFSWYLVQLNFFGNPQFFVDVPTPVTVRLQSLGPFRPRGMVRIGNGPLGNSGVQICTAALTPSAAGPFIAEATCSISIGQPGPRTIYADYVDLFESFHGPGRTTPGAERQVTVTTAPVDNLFCDGFESPYACAGRP